MAAYSLSEIKASYAQKREWERQLPLAYYIMRPLSFYVTWLMIRLVKRPEPVVWVSIVVGLAGWLAFCLLPEWGPWAGLILMTLFSLLDTVDGNIARVTRRVSYYGRFLDGTWGGLVEIGYSFCLCIGLARGAAAQVLPPLAGEAVHGPMLFLVAGGLMLVGRLYSQIASMAYYKLLVEKHPEEGREPEDLTATYESSVYRGRTGFLIWMNLHSLNMQLALLALCVVLDELPLWVGAFTVYYVVRLAVTMVFFTVRAARRLS